MYGELWRDLWAGPRDRSEALANTFKVTAHQLDAGKGAEQFEHMEDIDAAQELFKAKGNEWADLEAKAALANHPRGARWERTQLHDARVTLELAMVALKIWPKVGKLEKRNQGDDEARAIRRQEHKLQRSNRLLEARASRRRHMASHQWAQWKITIRCQQCLLLKTQHVGPCRGQHPHRSHRQPGERPRPQHVGCSGLGPQCGNIMGGHGHMSKVWLLDLRQQIDEQQKAARSMPTTNRCGQGCVEEGQSGATPESG